MSLNNSLINQARSLVLSRFTRVAMHIAVYAMAVPNIEDLSTIFGSTPTTTNCACRRFVSKDSVRMPLFAVTLTKGGSWALLSLQSSRPHWLSRSA